MYTRMGAMGAVELRQWLEDHAHDHFVPMVRAEMTAAVTDRLTSGAVWALPPQHRADERGHGGQGGGGLLPRAPLPACTTAHKLLLQLHRWATALPFLVPSLYDIMHHVMTRVAAGCAEAHARAISSSLAASLVALPAVASLLVRAKKRNNHSHPHTSVAVRAGC